MRVHRWGGPAGSVDGLAAPAVCAPGRCLRGFDVDAFGVVVVEGALDGGLVDDV